MTSLLNRDILRQATQMQLSQNLRDFSEFFFACSKSTLNFEHSQQENDPHS